MHPYLANPPLLGTFCPNTDCCCCCTGDVRPAGLPNVADEPNAGALPKVEAPPKPPGNVTNVHYHLFLFFINK